LRGIQINNSDLSKLDRDETRLDEHYVRCIDHWNSFLKRIPSNRELPSFPIWGDEIGATYPFLLGTPHSHTAKQLRRVLRVNGTDVLVTKHKLLSGLPSYARERERKFPPWKIKFIEQNRDWFETVHIGKRWLKRLRDFPPSLRKLEWNCQGEVRDLWKHVLQFRPSGLRVKRYAASPALVAMTTTQTPILGPKRRFITRIEGLRLQGFKDSHRLPKRRDDAFHALGNAVHVGVVRAIAKKAFKK
jgi:DNA (cytosine-5)-methyltransferase 1